MRIVYLTAGAAGMYCGSCMHDNAIARTLQQQGIDCVLVPLYTPIRTDERDVSNNQIFLGGINVFLQQWLPWLGYLPRMVRRGFDSPKLLNWATARTIDRNRSWLGDLTVSMLQGQKGRQRNEVDTLVHSLATEYRPTCIIFSNLLIGGCIPALRNRSEFNHTKIVVILQGDDFFLDQLPESSRQAAVDLMAQIAKSVDLFIVNTRFYAQKMGSLLNLPKDKFQILPLAVDVDSFRTTTEANDSTSKTDEVFSRGNDQQPVKIGYFARMAPEKGLHLLVDAFIRIATAEKEHLSELHIAGWLGKEHQPYLEQLVSRLHEAGLQNRYQYHGSLDLVEKRKFFQNIDLLSVPTTFEEPKGRYVLEAWAAGVPVIQPDHGAFTELLESGGGLLFPPLDVQALADGLQQLVSRSQMRHNMGRRGLQRVSEKHNLSNHTQELIKWLACPIK